MLRWLREEQSGPTSERTSVGQPQAPQKSLQGVGRVGALSALKRGTWLAWASLALLKVLLQLPIQRQQGWLALTQQR